MVVCCSWAAAEQGAEDDDAVGAGVVRGCLFGVGLREWSSMG